MYVEGTLKGMMALMPSDHVIILFFNCSGRVFRRPASPRHCTRSGGELCIIICLTPPQGTFGNREIINLFVEIQSQVRGQYYWSHPEGSTLPIINFHTRAFESIMPLLRHQLSGRVTCCWCLVACQIGTVVRYIRDDVAPAGWRTESSEETHTVCTSTAHTMIQSNHWKRGLFDACHPRQAFCARPAAGDGKLGAENLHSKLLSLDFVALRASGVISRGFPKIHQTAHRLRNMIII